MEITYYGQSCFRIKTRKASMVIDPYDSSTELKLPSLSADIVAVTHDHADHNNIEAVSGTTEHPDPFVIAGPGEYEISEIFIIGFSSYHDDDKGAKRGKNTIYLINSEGIKLAHLGDLGQKLTDRQKEELNQVDVLLVPVGGKYTINGKAAAEVVNQIEPSIVIPMHYQLPGFKYDLEGPEAFLEALGVESVKPVPKLVVRADILPEERQVVLMERKTK